MISQKPTGECMMTGKETRVMGMAAATRAMSAAAAAFECLRFACHLEGRG